MAYVCKRLLEDGWRGVVALALALLVALPARAELRIDITQGNVEPLPIAVTGFVGVTP
ncbi:MAG: Tol-Pal system protein TolB, partial [Rhodospirillales bacterium]|nr:Tol-Pal system protein TolB [Rhodospirillales bacterium]